MKEGIVFTLLINQENGLENFTIYVRISEMVQPVLRVDMNVNKYIGFYYLKNMQKYSLHYQ